MIDNLEASIEETFEFLEIKAEYKKIDIQREWIDPNIF